MSERAFLASIKDALAILTQAEVEAEAELGEDIKAQYREMKRSRQIVKIWDSLSWSNPRNRAVWALSLISSFRAEHEQLRLAIEADEREQQREAQGLSRYDLHLGKMRRETR